MTSAVCLCVRDEVNDLAEWLAHHRLIGFDRLIVYDNASTDGTSDLLAGFAELLPLDVVHWPHQEGHNQVAAFADCLARFGQSHDWLAFLDADEFLISKTDRKVSDLLGTHESHSAFAINWRIFGTSGVETTGGRLIMETFCRRGPVDFRANHNVKSFVRPQKVTRVVNPHYFETNEPYFDVLGNPIVWVNGSPGVVQDGTIVSDDWRVHHYVLRSMEHWQRRLARGRADPRTTRDRRQMFEHHDRNEEEDTTALPHADRVREFLDQPHVRNLTLNARRPAFGGAPRPRTQEINRQLIPAAAPEQVPTSPIPPDSSVVVARNIACYLDELSPALARGWALDLTDKTTPIGLQVLIDGQLLSVITCDHTRNDVKAAGLAERAGFEFNVPRVFFDGKAHRVEFRSVTNAPVKVHHNGEALDAFDLCQKWRPNLQSNVDGLRENVVKGWVLREDPVAHKWIGGCDVLVTCDGTYVSQIKANRHRPDVAKTHAADANCGFEFLAPTAFRKAHPQAFRFYMAPYDVELRGSPCTTSFVTDHQEAALLDMGDAVDRLYSEITRLRRQVRSMMPVRGHSLDDYEAWAGQYFTVLRATADKARHVNARRRRAERTEPLISVICSTYRPDVSHFVQAVESVIAQTYDNWELIVIDDGSQVPELTAQIDAFSRRDPRIRALKRPKNGGISNATNAGIKAARGEWITFFDHDDLLVDVALQVMVQAATGSGAKLLYSDEDKIDDTGLLSEPAFKSDWNYRLLLSANYVCHLVMVERATLVKCGPLQKKYDGAQDHDLLLRLAELLIPAEIIHVPEVLYHWRKTAASTASTTGAKEYAIAAGITCLTDLLARRGKPAIVSNFNDRTWYRIEWQSEHTPLVTIIIPFKDRIDITRECIDRVLGGTDYPNFDVILVDNWSTSDDAATFCDEMRQLNNVRVMRVEEEFNYSRLNNLAAREATGDLLVLMNNDLFVTGKAWLRTLVNEALADDQVGIVGGKFLYQNGTVQHAGVVLGVGGVATHVHTGLSEDDPGYGARALFAQELSAVTAACLLIKADIYRKVGGFDEKHLKVAFNDVDLCLKVRTAGYKIVWTPDFVAEHRESLSRGDDEGHPHKESRFFDEMQTMLARWGTMLANDPFYSKHFSLEKRPFLDLREPVLETLPAPYSVAAE